MTARVMILNGPNLNLLGVREPKIYGCTTLAKIEENCRAEAEAIGAAVQFHQSNHEGQLIDWIHEAREASDAIIVNPAGFSFTSVALLDALKMFDGPVIELHISNIHAREKTYHHSKISSVATAVICGLGAHGYVVALRCIPQLLEGRTKP